MWVTGVADKTIHFLGLFYTFAFTVSPVAATRSYSQLGALSIIKGPLWRKLYFYRVRARKNWRVPAFYAYEDTMIAT